MPAVLAAGMACAPLAQADSGDQATAEAAVRQVYNQVQARCTPSTPPAFQSITWQSFYPASWGQGRINDAHQGLGGPFKVYYGNPRVGPAQPFPGAVAVGQWDVVLEFC